MGDAFHSKRNHDVNWFYPTQYYHAVNNSDYDQWIGPDPVRKDGDTRIRDYPVLHNSVRPLGYVQPRAPYKVDNIWPTKFFNNRPGSGDVYSHYKYVNVPDGSYIPRSRANGAEYRRDVGNEYLYRRENEYELQNTVVDPTHLSQMTPERIAADPNQAIYNYYYGLTDADNKNMRQRFQYSRWRDTVRKNKRRVESQIYTMLSEGDDVKYEEIEPLFW